MIKKKELIGRCTLNAKTLILGGSQILQLPLVDDKGGKLPCAFMQLHRLESSSLRNKITPLSISLTVSHLDKVAKELLSGASTCFVGMYVA